MSSTNKTQTLGLNQWVLSDPFLMEDLNEDNRKIDDAAYRVRLVELELETATATFQFDLADTDTSKFIEFQLYVTVPGMGTHQSNYGLRVNSTRRYSYVSATGSGSADNFRLSQGKCALVPCGAELFWLTGKSSYDGRLVLDDNDRDIKKLLFYSGDGSAYPVGTKITLYGVKK